MPARFEAPLFEDVRWPRACAGCGAPPTRLDNLSDTTVQAAGLLIGRVGVLSGKVSGVQERDVVSDAERTLDVTGVFVAIGHIPRSELFADQVRVDESGYVIVEAPSTRTSVPGVFAAGDLVDHTYRQVITASGTVCVAALDAERYVASLSAAAGALR